MQLVNKDGLINEYISKNYNYIWYKAMLRRGRELVGKDATLITGSSYGLSGIKTDCFNNAVNLSMSSQDLYYDFIGAKRVIESVKKGTFNKCFIVKGYYAAVHDISLSVNERERIIKEVYYPILKDSHNWKLYEGDISDSAFCHVNEETEIEDIAIQRILDEKDYYSKYRARGGTVFNLNGRKWAELSQAEKEYLGKYRAEQHNKLFKHEESIVENTTILNDYVHFLHINNVMPIFVIAPFADVYTKNISIDMKSSVIEMLNKVKEDVHYVDMNETKAFYDWDFIDTDHLDERGAVKMCRMLGAEFGL